MVRIYEYPNDDNVHLPEEDVWLKHDDVVSNMEHSIRWAEEHGIRNEYAEENNRNFEVYLCEPGNIPPYERVTFERRYTLRYHEARSVDEFLINLNDYWQAVTYDRGYFFRVNTSDM
jgi:hypothetical protein